MLSGPWCLYQFYHDQYVNMYRSIYNVSPGLVNPVPSNWGDFFAQFLLTTSKNPQHQNMTTPIKCGCLKGRFINPYSSDGPMGNITRDTLQFLGFQRRSSKMTTSCGFNPFEKYSSKWESSPIFGVKVIQIFELPPPGQATKHSDPKRNPSDQPAPKGLVLKLRYDSRVHP